MRVSEHRLFTPADLATSPSGNFGIERPVYDSATQRNAALPDGSHIGLNLGSTQTFDVTGKPWDSDND